MRTIHTPANRQNSLSTAVTLGKVNSGEFNLHVSEFDVVKKTVDWEVSETAIIICDMWDDHYCKSAAQRVGVMAPTMN